MSYNKQPGRPFDFESLCGKLLILGKDVPRLQTAADYLKRINWPTQVTPSLEEGLKLLVETRPNFVFISIDHVSQKVLDLPQWMPINSQTTCVAFTENMTPESRQQLSDNSAFKYKMLKNVSGPTIALALRRILFERHMHIQNACHKHQEKNLPSLRASDFSHSTSKIRLTPSETLSSSSEVRTKLPLSDSIINAMRNLPFPDREPTSVLSQTRQLEVVPLFSEERTGYLVLSSNYCADSNRELIKAFKQSLSNTLSKNQSAVLMGEQVAVDTTQVDFPKWAKAHGEFYIKEQRGQGEVATCFVPQEKPLPTRISENKSGKIPIQINDIPVEMPLGFSAYLFLKQQKKYLPYLKKDSCLTSKQKEKLLENGKHLFIDPDDQPAFQTLFVKESIKSLVTQQEVVASA